MAQTVKSDGGNGTDDSGQNGSENGNQNGRIKRADNRGVMEQLYIPFSGKTAPHSTAVGTVKGEYDQHGDWCIKKDKNDRHIDAAEHRSQLFHSITACSSPSPNLFISQIQKVTIIIITREIAEPRYGL